MNAGSFATWNLAVVARGSLDPLFLDALRSTWDDRQIHVLEFSRWVYFKDGGPPFWVTNAPDKSEPLVLFDRDVSTGMTFRTLGRWLKQEGYRFVSLGHVLPEEARLGIHFIDYVYPDFQSTDSVAGVGGTYTVGFIGGAHALAPGGQEVVDLRGMVSFRSIVERVSVVAEGSDAFLLADNIQQIMMASYLLKRPPVVVSRNRQEIPADFDGADVAELYRLLGVS